jgi:hypothetical protein
MKGFWFPLLTVLYAAEALLDDGKESNSPKSCLPSTLLQLRCILSAGVMGPQPVSPFPIPRSSSQDPWGVIFGGSVLPSLPEPVNAVPVACGDINSLGTLCSRRVS